MCSKRYRSLCAVSRSLSKLLRLAQSEKYKPQSSNFPGHEVVTEESRMLHTALEKLILSRNDPRARLEVFRLLPRSLTYCVTTPRGKYDPLMIFPQLFTFETSQTSEMNAGRQELEPTGKIPETDRRFAVPLFTSFPLLEHFARRLRCVVRGPDDALWVDGTVLCQPSLEKPPTAAPSTLSTPTEPDLMQEGLSYRIRPLFPFGPPTTPYLVGCFAAYKDLMPHIQIFPDSTDLVLNLGTPLEWHIKRPVANELQLENNIDATIYHEIARAVCTSLSRFFHLYCPEVREGKYCVMPQGERSGPEASDHLYTIFIHYRSDEAWSTKRKVEEGQQRAQWVGHPCVRVLESDSATQLLHEASEVFYVPPPREVGFRTVVG